jgi:hypothetical protein
MGKRSGVNNMQHRSPDNRISNSNHIPPRAPNPKTLAPKELLKPEQMAKIFGTQENFNMIKSLLNSQQNFAKGAQSTE